MNAIQITNLTKFYGKARGITQLDLTVEKGEFFGFDHENPSINRYSSCLS